MEAAGLAETRPLENEPEDVGAKKLIQEDIKTAVALRSEKMNIGQIRDRMKRDIN